MSKQSGRTDEVEAVAAALASDPRALEAYSSASPAHLLDLLARACAACRADVSVFASSALLALARRGALPHEHWETALSVCTAPNCAEAARSQCARALAAAAARSPTALDDALALGQRGGIACWTALATECPHRGGDGAACWASAAAAALDAAARAGATVEAVACAARWLETGACLRRGGTGERPGASPLGAGGGALARSVGAAAASGDARAARAACEVLEAAAAAGSLRPGDDAELEALGAAHAQARSSTATADPAATRARRRFAACLARVDAVATGRCARPWDAGVLAEVAEGCVGTDAAAAEACCAAWSALVLTGGGARRLADRRPALLERTRDLAPRLVARVVWPRGGLADAPEPLDEADDDANAALHGDDAAALPENAGAWTESLEWDAYRRLRDAFLGECLRSTSDALGAARYVEAVLAGARRVDANDADVLAAAARCLSLAGPLLARGASDDAAASTALSNAVHACVAAAAAAPPGPRQARLVAATALLLGGVHKWLCDDDARLTEALQFLAYSTHVVGGAGHACRAARAVLQRCYAAAVVRTRGGAARLVADAALPALAEAAEASTAPPDGARAAFYRALGAAALWPGRDGADHDTRAAAVVALAAPAAARLGGAGAAQGRDLRVVAALVREATRHGAQRAEAAVADATLGAVRARWHAAAGAGDEPGGALEDCAAAFAAAAAPHVVLGVLEILATAPYCDGRALRVVSEVTDRWGARAEAALAGNGNGGGADGGAAVERLARGLAVAVPAVIAAAPAGDEAGRALLTLAAAAAAHCPSVLADGGAALPAALAAAARELPRHRESPAAATAACALLTALGAFAPDGEAEAKTMAGADNAAGASASAVAAKSAAVRRARAAPAVRAALGPVGPALVEHCVAPAFEASPPLLPRDRGSALLALHALAPDDVAALAATIAGRLRPDLAPELAAALALAREKGRTAARRQLIAVFSKAALDAPPPPP